MAHLYGPQARVEKRFSDGYNRRPFDERKDVYRLAIDLIRGRRPNLRVTLCQEENGMYDAVKGASLLARCNCMVGLW